MTALAPLIVPARQEDQPTLRPVPWRRMTWVIWRQHRTALVCVAALLGALALLLLIVGLQLHHAYAAAAACHPAGSLSCDELTNTFNGIGGFLSNGLLLQAVPVLIGAFVGAPVLARELETSTFRFAWTQGFGRVRWTLAKLSALGIAVAAATGALGLLLSWYFQPYFATGNQTLALIKSDPLTLNPLAPGLFDLRGLAFPAWTLVAFAIGVLAGILIRRVVPAIVATLAVYAGLAIATGGWLRQHYLTPLVTRKLNVPGSGWMVGQQWTTNSGHHVSQSVITQVLEKAPSTVTGKGGIPDSFTTMQYIFQHGYTHLTKYQPVSRFWAFQWIEGGWLLALSVLLIGGTVLLVRRRVI